MFINQDLIILIPSLMIIGFLIKKSELVFDNFIPLYLGAFGIILSLIFYFCQNFVFDFTNLLYGIFFSITQGSISAGMAVYFYQILKQSKNYYKEK